MGLPTALHNCPILREPDGLAMSSRNTRLDPEQRLRAVAIYKTLKNLQSAWRSLPNEEYPTRPISLLVAKATEALESAHFRVDYVSIADRDTLEPAQPDSENAIALIAAFMGEVRLIDNMLL
jgi:pantoate--beta-alanine ligase